MNPIDVALSKPSSCENQRECGTSTRLERGGKARVSQSVRPNQCAVPKTVEENDADDVKVCFGVIFANITAIGKKTKH